MRILALLVALVCVSPAQADEERFIRERLVGAIRLLDTFRVEETGQYLDAIHIGEETQPTVSSIAATGIGLVSLAMADALGIDEKAEEKALVTLRNLLNQGDPAFRITRSRRGWYPHFIDANTGAATFGSQDRFSTIDTALLSAGAAIAARYFNAKSFTEGEGESPVFRLAGQVVGGVAWQSAIHDVERGLVHLVFKNTPEDPRAETPLVNIFANPFDEYAVLPCMAMRGEQMGRQIGPAHELFFKHYNRADELPMNDFEGESVIAKPSGAFIAHFTHLFAYFYCDHFNTQGAYRRELRELASADRKWFARRDFSPALWGLGAGAEVKFAEDGTVERTGYGVNSLSKNPNDTASPAIMAGFAAVYRTGEDDDPVPDLMALWEAGICRYEHRGVPFLWRCSAREPQHKVRRVEAVDFSTMLLGLAARDSAFGMAFFRTFNL